MPTRRTFLLSAAAIACGKKSPPLGSTERVDFALQGKEVDRPPFTVYYHFGLERFPGERHAKATLEFHQRYHTDLVKVMSDYPYPKPSGKWFELRVLDNPYPEQVRALELIRDGLKGEAYFVETLFNPWNVAEKLSSKEEVQKLKSEKPEVLLQALDVIARSEANHAKKAIAAGASGIFLAIANAQEVEDYAKFSEPFDKQVLEAASGAPLNILHIHGDKTYVQPFYSGWPASVIQYSLHGTGIPIAKVRQSYGGVVMGGLDERKFRAMPAEEMETQWKAAQEAAGRKFILAPGCSVPNETTDVELSRLTRLMERT